MGCWFPFPRWTIPAQYLMSPVLILLNISVGDSRYPIARRTKSQVFNAKNHVFNVRKLHFIS